LSISPNASGFPASCPTDDRKVIRDNNGVAYQIFCATDPGAQNGGGESGATATNSFNDCFAFCDAAVLSGGGGRCTGFTYVGQVNGVGGGNCYLKSGVSYSINSAGNNLVGAVRQADAVSNSSSSVVLASTTSTSVLSGSSSSVVLASTSSSVPSSSSSVVRSSSSSIVLASSTSSGGSSSVSSSVSSSSSAAATGSYSCPANDQQIITNNGTQYQLRCGSPAVPVTRSGSYFRDPTIRASFNECLQGCTTNAFEVPAGSGTYPICTGTTFTITDTATGAGTCSYRQQNPLMFDVPSQYFTGLIKVQYYQAPSSSVSSSSVASSSIQPQTVTQYQTVTSSYPVTYTQPGKSHLSVQCPARLTSI
jgi:hypothetical protein